MEELGAGAVLANRYRLESLIGKGGMGSVWRAQHLTLNSPVAIKLMAVERDPSALDRFMREAQAAAALRSPHVVQTFDYGVHEGVPYIALELLEGESLSARLKRCGPLSPAEAANLLTQVGRAVGKAHEAGIVHRDLKPDNVFIVRNDDEEIAKVLDFGIAKLTSGSLDSTSQTRTGAILGTPYYMSPEQAAGARTIDHRSDLWSMGVIAYECLLGARPFRGESIGELVLEICTKPAPVPSSAGPVPAGFDAWFARACARHPEARFQSARALTESLRALTMGSDTLLADSSPIFAGAALDMGSTGAPVASPTLEPMARRRGVPLWAKVLAGIGVLAGGTALVTAVASPSQRDSEASVAATATRIEARSLADRTKAPVAVGPAVTPTPTTSTSEPEPPAAAGEATDETEAPAAPTPARRTQLSPTTARPAPPKAATVPEPAAEAAARGKPSAPRPAPAPKRNAEEPTDFGF